MKTLLISVSYRDRLDIENLGLERIYAYLKDKKETDIIYINQTTDIENELSKIDLQYDIYAFSAYQDNMDTIRELALAIKQLRPESYIILGSKYVTSYYKDIVALELEKEKQCFDFLVLGYGEYTILDIINCLERKDNIDDFVRCHENIATIRSTENKKALTIDIRELPIPERTFIKNNNSITAYICDSHGCLGRCSFCSASFDNKWSGRSAESLFEEVLYIYNNTKARIIIFTGSSFEDPGDRGKERISKFCDLMIDAGIPVSFRCYLRAESFKDCDSDINLLQKMKMAGFSQVYIGIESNNEEDLRLYCKRATVKDNNRIFKLLNQVGIFCGEYGFIMFNPYSTLEGISNNFNFIKDNQPFNLYPLTTKLIIYKGTRAHDLIKKDNLIKSKDCLSYNVVEDYYFVNKDVSALYDFVNQYIISPQELKTVMSNTGFVTSLLYDFSYFPDIKESVKELSVILSRYEEIIKEYFYWLYVKNDIGFCERTYEKFKSDLLSNDKNMRLLKNRFIKKMMKHNIFLS